MMFLQYVIWGSWYVTLNTYLTSTLHFSGTEAGAVFGTTAVASLVSPFFVGLVADRFFATERVMATMYALSAIIVFLVTRVTSFPAVYSLVLAFCLCYFPTIALTNSISQVSIASASSIGYSTMPACLILSEACTTSSHVAGGFSMPARCMMSVLHTNDM